jgi:hypothetical protein
LPRSTTTQEERLILNKIRKDHDDKNHEECDICFLLNLIHSLFEKRENRSSEDLRLIKKEESFQRGDPGHFDNEMGM